LADDPENGPNGGAGTFGVGGDGVDVGCFTETNCVVGPDHTSISGVDAKPIFSLLQEFNAGGAGTKISCKSSGAAAQGAFGIGTYECELSTASRKRVFGNHSTASRMHAGLSQVLRRSGEISVPRIDCQTDGSASSTKCQIQVCAANEEVQFNGAVWACVPAGAQSFTGGR